jgi:hypothetical protein
MLLDLALVEGVARGLHWVLVNVSEEDGLRVVWTDMFPAAGFAVATGADFVEEGAVYFVLLGSAG